MAGSKGKASEKLRRAAKTLFFMLTMLFSLLFLSLPVLFTAADAAVALAITARLAGEFRRAVLDVNVVAVGRSIVVACTYASYKGTGLANAPYLRVTTLCCASSVLFLFVKACLFNPSPQIDNGAPPSLETDHLHCKVSWGVAALFVSSMVFALGHVIIAYRTTNRARRKMFYRLDPEAVLGCKRVLCGFQKVPRSPTPGTGRVSKYSSETRRKLLLHDNHDVVSISLLADLDSCFIACHDLTVHYKLSSYDSCPSIVSSPYAESSCSSSPTSMSSENLNFDKSMTSSPKAHINRSLSNQFTTPTLYTPLLPVSATSKKKVSEETPTFYLGDDYDKDLCPTSSINFDVDVEGGGKFGIILVHGFGGGVFSWRHVSGVLARQVGCPVVAFDRPGWGLTSRPRRKDWENRQLPNPFELETQVDLLLSFCSALGFSSVVLVGHDDGGLLALKAVEKIRTSPDSISVEIKGVVLLGVSLSREVVPSFARILLHTSLGKKHMVRPLLRTEITQVINRRAWYDATKLTTEVLNLYKAPLYVEGWEEALHEIGRLSFSTVLSQQNADALLESVKNLPVLVVMGAEDALVPFKSAQVLASKLTNSRLVAISGCGHLPHEECPRELLEALSPFITRLLLLQDEYERR